MRWPKSIVLFWCLIFNIKFATTQINRLLNCLNKLLYYIQYNEEKKTGKFQLLMPFLSTVKKI